MTKVILVIFWLYSEGVEPVRERQEMEDLTACEEIANQLNSAGHFAFCGIETVPEIE